MKILYFDCSSGASGDMILGALLDSGAIKLKKLKAELRKLRLKNFSISAPKCRKNSISATKFKVHYNKNRHSGRLLKDVLALIERSKLSPSVKENAKKIFINLAIAESKVHGIKAQKVHFHEVCDIDSIVDIVGVSIAIELIGADKFYTSNLTVGNGLIKTEHGVLPSPGPATLELLKGRKLKFSDIDHELLTPTAAAVFKVFTREAEPRSTFKIERMGYGAGEKDFDGISNVLRIIIGEIESKSAQDEVMVLEANIDDMTPLAYESIYEKLFEKGALDVYMTQIIMKKMRPAVTLSVICHRDRFRDISKLLLNETTTLGVRFTRYERLILERTAGKVKTSYGNIRVKIARGPGGLKRITPEYDDCVEVARSKNIPFIKVYSKVLTELESIYGDKA